MTSEESLEQIAKAAWWVRAGVIILWLSISGATVIHFIWQSQRSAHERFVTTQPAGTQGEWRCKKPRENTWLQSQDIVLSGAKGPILVCYWKGETPRSLR